MKRLFLVAALVVAVTAGAVAAQEDLVETEHFPQWMIDESYLLGATAPVSVKEVVCGPVYRNAGTVVTLETLGGVPVEREGVACGGQLPRGGWLSGSSTDALDDSTWSWASLRSDQEIGWRYDHPELGVQCVNDTLGIFVQTGGYVAENVWSDRIAVAYRFGDSDVVEQGWRELISGDEGNVGAWMPAGYRRAFVDALRTHAEGVLVFRMWNFDGTEVGTMAFSLTGVQRVVEPILQECGW